MLKTLILLNSEDNIKKAVSLCKSNDLIMPLNVFLGSKIKAQRKDLYSYDIDVSNINKEAWNLVNKWLSSTIDKHSLQSLFTHRKYSFLKINRTPLYEYMTRLIKQLMYLDKVITTEKSSRIIVFESDSALIEKDRSFLIAVLRILRKKHKFSLVIQKRNSILKNIALRKSIKAAMKLRTLQRSTYQQLPASKTTNLFFCYGIYMLDICMTKTLFQNLSDQDSESMYICADGVRSSSGHDYAKENNCYYSYLEPFMDQELKRKARGYEKKNKKSWKTLVNNHQFRELFRYKSFDIFPILLPYLKHLLVDEFRNHIRSALAIEKLIRKCNPKIAFFTNDSLPWSANAVNVLRQQKIRTVFIAPSSWADKYGSSVLNSDCAFVWSKMEQQKFLDMGVAKNRLFISGTDAYSKVISKFRNLNPDDIRYDLKLGTQKVIVFVCRFYIGQDIQRIWKLIQVLENTNHILIVKMHPGDMCQSPKELLKFFNSRNLRIIRDYSFYKLLKISDLVISNEACTTSQDAIAFSAPLVQWIFPAKDDEDAVCKIPIDTKLKILKMNGLNGMNLKKIESAFDNKFVNQYKKQSAEYVSQYFHSLDMKKIKDFITKHKY